MQRGNNDINAGIAKNWQYLTPLPLHENPIHWDDRMSPHFYVAVTGVSGSLTRSLSITSKRDGSDETTDKPVDRNDHAMDMWKYAMSNRPSWLRILASLMRHLHGWRGMRLNVQQQTWSESEAQVSLIIIVLRHPTCCLA